MPNALTIRHMRDVKDDLQILAQVAGKVEFPLVWMGGTGVCLVCVCNGAMMGEIIGLTSVAVRYLIGI